MSDSPKLRSRFPVRRRVWVPVAITGAGGTAVAIWFEEIAAYAEEIIGLILLPIMAGIIYLLDILMFKSRMPGAKDLTDTAKRGARK